MNYGVVIGYHGCRHTTAQAVLRGTQKHLRPSDSNSEWLGKGVYFWENSYDLAIKWAERHYPEDPDVLGAIIIPGQCLDLTDSECSAVLASFGRFFEKLYVNLYNRRLPVNRAKKEYHPYDCALINTYREAMELVCPDVPPIETVRAAFQEGERIARSTFRKFNHIQWAIPNPEKNILGYFRPSDIATMPRFPEMERLYDSIRGNEPSGNESSSTEE